MKFHSKELFYCLHDILFAYSGLGTLRRNTEWANMSP